MRLSGTGIWSSTLRYGDAAAAAGAAAELEALGKSALWLPDVGGDLFGPLGNLLGATTTATIATGILNIWMHTPQEAAAEHARLTAEHGPRLLFGMGISHRRLIDHAHEPGRYQRPIETMSAYLDGLDAAAAPLAAQDRVIAALGPRMPESARPFERHASALVRRPGRASMGVQPDGRTPVIAVDRLPLSHQSQAVATLPMWREGQQVVEGQLLLVMEMTKMEHRVAAPFGRHRH